MKAVVGVVLVVLCISTLGSCDIPGTLVGFSRLASRSNDPSCVDKITPICKDCRTLLRCLMVDPAPEVTCNTQYPGKPYCYEGTCVAEPPADCLAPYICTGAGYYPEPKNCSRYHLCASAGSTGTAHATYECPTGFVYNPLTTMCKLSTDCTYVDCSTDPNGYVAYPGDNRYYAYCMGDEDPIILKCATYHAFNFSTKACVFDCPRAGRIPDLTDEKKYYDCYLSGSIYYYRESTCIDGYVFDDGMQQCRLQ